MRSIFISMDWIITTLILFILSLNGLAIVGVDISFYTHFLNDDLLEFSALSLIQFGLIYFLNFFTLKGDLKSIRIKYSLNNSINIIVVLVGIINGSEALKFVLVLLIYSLLGNLITYSLHKKSFGEKYRLCKIESIWGVSDEGTKYDQYYTWFFAGYVVLFFALLVLLKNL